MVTSYILFDETIIMMSYDVGRHPMTPIPMSLFILNKFLCFTYLPPFCVQVGVKRCVYYIKNIYTTILTAVFLFMKSASSANY